MNVSAAADREQGRSLNEVRAIIPSQCYERPLPRALLAVGQAWVLYGLAIAGLILTNRWWALPVLWLLAGFAVSGLFVLGHDASHMALVESRRLNRVLAQVCMGPSAHVEAAWDLGHNRIHHGYTARQGFDFVWHPATPAEYAAMSRYRKLQHRVEWSWLGSGAYFMRTVWWEKMWRFNPPGKRHDAVVRDKITLGSALVGATVALGALGWVMGGWASVVWMPVKVLLIPMLIFMHTIGWTVYVHHIAPDIRWWPRKEWTQFHGQMESTTVLAMPKVINTLWFHNIFVHVPHHVDMRIPFHQLPRAARAIGEAYPDTVRFAKMSIPAYLRTTKACKLYDFEAGHWLPYSAASA
jgi:omega-6 fatty acid desaturase (delta-12 desaturase)